MSTAKRYSPETRERAVRLVLDAEAQRESQWAAISSIAPKIGLPEGPERGSVGAEAPSGPFFAWKVSPPPRPDLCLLESVLAGPARSTSTGLTLLPRLRSRPPNPLLHGFSSGNRRVGSNEVPGGALRGRKLLAVRLSGVEGVGVLVVRSPGGDIEEVLPPLVRPVVK